MNNTRLFILLFPLLLSGCKAAWLPQNRVMFSNHPVESNQFYSQSYPAKLRASSIHFALSANIPAGVYTAYGKKQTEMLAAQAKLNALPEKSQDRETIQKEIETLRKEMRLLVQDWVRPRILAEPPPDVAESMKFLLDFNPTGAVMKQAGVKAETSTAISQISLSAESDVKRHLMYRLNEALFNEPEAILPIYGTLFTAIVNLQVPATPTDKGGAATTAETQQGKPETKNQTTQPDTGKQQCTTPAPPATKPATADAATTPQCTPQK